MHAVCDRNAMFVKYTIVNWGGFFQLNVSTL